MWHGPAPAPLRIVHGVAFSAWILLFVTHTTVAAGRTDLHPPLGFAGAVLAVGMVVLGSVLAVWNAREGWAPPGVPPLPFLIIPLFDICQREG